MASGGAETVSGFIEQLENTLGRAIADCRMLEFLAEILDGAEKTCGEHRKLVRTPN